MATILFPAPIFGPVQSRRLGVSLGINLMPSEGKLCTFDCIYCECGLNGDRRTDARRPTREEVAADLEAQLRRMREEGRLPDVITFAGNGEPTAHVHFPEIIDDTLRLRDEYCPQAKVAVLSNATLAHLPKVREALMKIDDNILKLDTVSEEYIRLVDRPVGRYSVEKLIETLRGYGDKCMIQTLFMKGTAAGKSVDNTGDEYVLPWLEAVRSIRPKKVMIYTIDRETPTKGLLKATPEELDRIADLVRAAGIDAETSY